MNRVIAVSLLAIVLLWLPVQSIAGHTVIVRDATGRVIERRYINRNRTVVRNAQGRVIRVETVNGKTKVIRDATGRVIRRETFR